MSQIPKQYSPPGQGSTRLVIVALVIAAMAVVLVNVYISIVRSQARGSEFVVYQLMRTVEPGDTFRGEPNDVKRLVVDSRFSEGFVGALNETEMLNSIGRTFQRRAARMAPLTHELFQISEDDQYHRQITVGHRAVALPINPRLLPAGFTYGSYIDIVAPFQIDTGVDILPVIERVQVRGIGDLTTAGNTTALPRTVNTITIEVTPEQARQLSRIKRRVAGDFDFHLRNPADEGEPELEGGGINPRVLELLERPAFAADGFDEY